MIDKIITTYLKSNKRLVIPDFGAFIHKEGEEVVFVEFLKKDDRVLSSLLCKEYAIDETEAQSAISEYVMRIRRTVGATGRYVVEGLGSLHTDVNGLYALAYDPRVRKEASDIEIPTPAEPAPIPERPVMQVYTRDDDEEKQAVQDVASGSHRVASHSGDTPKSSPNVIEFGFPEQKPEPQPKPTEKKSFTLNDLYSIPASEDTRADQPRSAPRPAQTAREDRSAQPQMRGERSAQPQRIAADMDRTRQPIPERRVRRDDDWENEPPRRRPAKKQAKKIVDWIVIIAIIVALFALATIIYGIFTDSDINIKQTNPSQIENTTDMNAAETENGTLPDVE